MGVDTAASAQQRGQDTWSRPTTTREPCQHSKAEQAVPPLPRKGHRHLQVTTIATCLRVFRQTTIRIGAVGEANPWTDGSQLPLVRGVWQLADVAPVLLLRWPIGREAPGVNRFGVPNLFGLRQRAWVQSCNSACLPSSPRLSRWRLLRGASCLGERCVKRILPTNFSARSHFHVITATFTEFGDWD